MSSKEYFKLLCDTEAGEFVYRSVKNVDGLMMLRARPLATTAMFRDRYAMEDPFGYENWEATTPEELFIGPKRYRYFEKYVSKNSDRKIGLFFGYVARREGVTMHKSPMQVEYRDTPKSKYGYTWRGIKRENDRELGIAGGELIVLEIETKEVLGVRRGYVRSGNARGSRTGIWWPSGEVCPKSQRDIFATRTFLQKVLVPSNRTAEKGIEQ